MTKAGCRDDRARSRTAMAISPFRTRRLHGIEGKITWDTENDEYRFYAERGARLKVTLAAPLPTGVQDIGHWLNQSYVIRLCGVLEEHGINAKRRKDSEIVDILLS